MSAKSSVSFRPFFVHDKVINNPSVSIIIPCRNEVDFIGACLESVLQFEPPYGGFEVLVVDGFSDDGTVKVVQQFASKDARVRLLNNAERTVPHAMNIGIRAARGKYIARLDAHSRYDRDYLVRCFEVMKQTGADNVGGPWIAAGHGRIQRAVAAAFASSFAIGNSHCHFPDYEGPVHSVYPGFYSRQTLLDIGLYDEELVRNQDDELNLRLQLAGGKIYQSPKIKLRYYPRSSFKQLFKQYLQYGYWKVRVMQKHQLLAAWRHLAPGALVLGILGGPLVYALSSQLFRVWLCIIAIYMTVSIVTAIKISVTKGWDLLWLLPLVFWTYHVSYGLGFLNGLVDFLVLRKHHSGTIKEPYLQLTR